MAEFTKRSLPVRPRMRLGLPRVQGTFNLFEDVLCVLIPASYCFEFALVGRLFANEILLLFLLPLLVIRRGSILKQKFPSIFLMLCAAWLIAQVITDLVRDIDSQDYLRGWAKIAITFSNFSAAYLLINGMPRRFVLYTFGLATGSLLQVFTNPSTAFEADSWKFGYSTALMMYGTLIAVALTGTKGDRWIAPAATLSSLGAVNFLLGSRGNGMILLMAAGFLSLKGISPNFLIRPSKLTMILVMVLGLVGAGAIVQGYEYAASSGLLGHDALEKYEQQSGGDLPLILSGRPQIVGAVMAIADSPILGHGSWAKDKEYAIQLQETMRRLGVEVLANRPGSEMFDELIPSHSHLLGAWVEAGIMGAVFWAFALFMTGRALFGFMASRPNRLDPLIVLSALWDCWSILFSPYGAEERFYTTFWLVFMIWFVQLQRSDIGPQSTPLAQGRQDRSRKLLRKPTF